MTQLPLVGGCQCGALRYEVNAAPLMIYNCHCTNCQKIGGGAFSTPVTVVEAAFAFTRGKPAVVNWASDAGTQRWGTYCADCGSRIAHGQTPSKGVLSLRTGTLDDTSWVEPVADTWLRSKQSWVQIPEGRLTFEKGPADYAPLMAKFREQGRF
jgi:hypothetical protein